MKKVIPIPIAVIIALFFSACILDDKKSNSMKNLSDSVKPTSTPAHESITIADKLSTETKDNNLECKDDEIFLTNTFAGPDEYMNLGPYANSNKKHFSAWKTIRYGSVAYDVNGHPIKGMMPVFVKKWEYNQKNKLK